MTKAAFSAWLLSLAILSSVTLTAVEPIQDRGITSYDPNTGLEWLDLSFTAGRSYDDVLRGLQGASSAGFRFATRNEVITLFNNFGATRFDQQANAQAANTALLFLGTTLPMPGSNLYRSWMFYDPLTESTLPTPSHISTAVFGVGEIGGGIEGPQGFFLTPGLFPSTDYSSPELASALVRTVPEPSPVLQIAFGFVLLVAASTVRCRSSHRS